MHLRPKQIVSLLLSGDMQLKDVPDCEYMDATIKSHVEDMLNDMVEDGTISREKYESIASTQAYDPFPADASPPASDPFESEEPPADRRRRRKPIEE